MFRRCSSLTRLHMRGLPLPPHMLEAYERITCMAVRGGRRTLGQGGAAAWVTCGGSWSGLYRIAAGVGSSMAPSSFAYARSE
eukprot:scaffold27985_cov46-Phaeocystis_antarctica.AAC.4